MNEHLTERTPITFGADPELFFSDSEGHIIGAEKVLPASGVLPGLSTHGTPTKVILDGVQVELNPAPNSCRQVFGAGVATAFAALKQHLTGKDVKTCFDAVITIDKKELDSLSEKSRQFGCAPSNNFYDHDVKIKANPAKYLKRSAGGHIHLGLGQPGSLLMTHRERLVPIFDTLIGNTCVMIDRCPEAAERRKNYGRAGEYRLPAYGIEYRTLSNFWLRSYPLLGLVLGLARLSVSGLNATLMKRLPNGVANTSWWDVEHKLMCNVDLKRVQKAINQNDLDLAKQNWQPVREFILNHVPQDRAWRHESGVDAGSLDAFEHFLRRIESNGLTYWFPEDPLAHWCKQTCRTGEGWEAFLDGQVRADMAKTVEAAQ